MAKQPIDYRELFERIVFGEDDKIAYDLRFKDAGLHTVVRALIETAGSHAGGLGTMTWDDALALFSTEFMKAKHDIGESRDAVALLKGRRR
jgi:hypothetical protein